VVHRWAYDYNVPGIEQDFVPQTTSPEVATIEHTAQRQQEPGVAK
jgi:cytochrome c oxidase subunit 1